MRILVLDPSFSEFGHHVGFNRHVLECLGTSNDVCFFDVAGIMKNVISSDVKFVQINDAMFGGEGKPLDGKAFQERQKKIQDCANFWAYVEGLKPDVVILTSEGNHRKGLYCSIPKNKSFKLFVIAHAVWSLNKTLNDVAEVSDAFKTLVDGIFVIEPFLAYGLIQRGYKSFWFPHRGYNSTPLLNEKSSKRKSVSIGTIGVINERRNHSFIIEGISKLKKKVNFVIAGELMDKVAEEVTEAVENLEKKGVSVDRSFGYLSDADFESKVENLDVGVLAYDETRSLQASGALYTYTALGVPLLVPGIRLFRNYDILYPGLLKLYDPLSHESFVAKLSELIDDFSQGRCRDFLDARSTFLDKNHYGKHSLYVRELLLGVLQGNTGNSWLRLANQYSFHDNSIMSEAFYLACLNNESQRIQGVQGLEYLYTRKNATYLLGLVKRFYMNFDRKNWLFDDYLKKTSTKIFVFPEFANKEDQDLFLARLYWNLFPIVNSIESIVIISSVGNLRISKRDPYIADCVYDLEELFIDKVQAFSSVDDCVSLIKQVDFTYLTSYSTPEERARPFPKILDFLYKKPIWRVDENRERFATSHFLKSVSALVDVERTRLEGQQALARVRSNFKSGRIAVFGTGPSLSEAFNHSFAGVDTIAANSMVKNIPLLDHIRPKLMVCADPIFHAGPSTYAEEFRQQMLYALKRYSCSLMVPERDVHVYKAYFNPHNIEVIAIPLEKKGAPNFNIPSDYWVESTGNILTLFLLQLAYSFSSEVDIYGCDGRPLDQNNYFWGHDKSAQFNDKMDDIKLAHPGFFNIDYSEYYEEHCNTLSSWLDEAESVGKKTHSKTFSYIPALVKRSVSN